MKRIICMVLASLLIISMVGTVCAESVPGEVYGDHTATGVNKPRDEIKAELEDLGIKDVSYCDWFAGSVTEMVQSGLMTLDENGNFRPGEYITYFEGVPVIAKILGIADIKDSPEQALKKANEAGLIDKDILSNPNRVMSRLALARVLATALGVKPAAGGTDRFIDADSIPASDKGNLNALFDIGVFEGYEDISFRGGNNLTRAHFAIIIDRLLGGKR